MRIAIVPVTCFTEVEAAWRALEAQAPDLSFFRSWTWVGCLAEERYPDPVLLRAEAAGCVLGLALFNRRRGRFLLGESGDPALDAPFVEHNGPLLGAGAGPEVTAAIMAAAWSVPGVRRLVLSGVPPEVARLAGGVPFRVQEHLAPFLDLAAARASGADWMGMLSANTRQQLRRALRHYAARGPLTVERAGTPEEAQAWLAALTGLHARRWAARGAPGAFATPYLRRFHATLVARALARDELDLLRVAAGGHVIGFLYNLRLRGRVLAYQGGFDYEAADGQGRPGLTCHALAISQAFAGGVDVYDFLAPADRYKTSLSSGATPLAWVEVAPAFSPLGAAAALRRLLRPLTARLQRGPGQADTRPTRA
ncbi:MAG TPA: GNAT family N-acetyltransferase [Acetobacteraceae bacterium]|nr:GNAT family N-acetyltransferase [Acetobacteraceae bacterium]